jgi:histidinol-phosphatase (PHP family)
VIVDYHMHLRGPSANGAEPLDFSVDAAARFAETAVAAGVDEIGFTEHVYYFRQTREIWQLPYHVERCLYDLDEYCDAVLEARRRGLPVKLGLEVDYVGERQHRLAELLEPYPWDLLLGSAHEVLDIAIDQEPGIWEQLSIEDVWRRYVAEVCELARSRLVDVMAHPDLAKIYGERPSPEVLEELYEDLAEALAAGEVAAEISTAGLRKPVGELYPSAGLLDAFQRHRVPVTTASDAHEPRLVGADFDRALAHARSAGYETVSVLDRRVRRQVALG